MKLGERRASLGDTLQLIEDYQKVKLDLFILNKRLLRQKGKSIEPTLNTGNSQKLIPSEKICKMRNNKKRSVFSPQTTLNEVNKH